MIGSKNQIVKDGVVNVIFKDQSASRPYPLKPTLRIDDYLSFIPDATYFKFYDATAYRGQSAVSINILHFRNDTLLSTIPYVENLDTTMLPNDVRIGDVFYLQIVTDIGTFSMGDNAPANVVDTPTRDPFLVAIETFSVEDVFSNIPNVGSLLLFSEFSADNSLLFLAVNVQSVNTESILLTLIPYVTLCNKDSTVNLIETQSMSANDILVTIPTYNVLGYTDDSFWELNKSLWELGITLTIDNNDLIFDEITNFDYGESGQVYLFSLVESEPGIWVNDLFANLLAFQSKSDNILAESIV